MHGGLDQHNREASIVVGQKNIHNKIQQLNFRDCHAKISQVDAQATLGNGVVVQVTGELSNDGQPMRRFTQTFVLAAQSPKKYYVHNDIFRYQDFYSDDEIDGESGNRSDNDEEIPENEPIETTNLNQPPQIFYPHGVQAPAAQTVPIQPFAQPVQMNGVVHDDIIQVIPAAINMPITPAPVQNQPQQQQPQPENANVIVDPIVPTKLISTVSSAIVPSPEESNEIITQKLNDSNVTETNVIVENEPPLAAETPNTSSDISELSKDDSKLQFNFSF